LPRLARRASASIAVVALALLLFTGCTPLNSQEQYLFDRTNQLRIESGLKPVYEYEPLTAKAREWAAHLALQGRLAHQNLRALGVDWSAAAENVGRSSSIEDVVARLHASPAHRANTLNPAFEYVGVGTARAKDGTVYAVTVFLRA
jgi:uncharacterized protein YkwD